MHIDKKFEQFNTNSCLMKLIKFQKHLSLSFFAVFRLKKTGVLTFYPTRQIFLTRLTAHARINIASFFSC